jgi:hypothetical protein
VHTVDAIKQQGMFNHQKWDMNRTKGMLRSTILAARVWPLSLRNSPWVDYFWKGNAWISHSDLWLYWRAIIEFSGVLAMVHDGSWLTCSTSGILGDITAKTQAWLVRLARRPKGTLFQSLPWVKTSWDTNIPFIYTI